MHEEKLFDDIVERELFLELIADGIPPNLAGFQCQWTPRQTKLNLADPEFAQLVRAARTRAVDSVEHMLFAQAKKGNMAAIQMVLYNERGEQWRDVKRIEVRGEVTVNHIDLVAAKEVALAELRRGNIGELQPGGVLDAESYEDTDGDLG